MAATIVAGFSLQWLMGRSTLRAPLHVHIHAWLFMGWTAFYVFQTHLITSGARAQHRRLGWIGAIWASLLVLVGIYTTVVLAREDRKSVVQGKSVSVRVDLGGRRIIKKKSYICEICK